MLFDRSLVLDADEELCFRVTDALRCTLDRRRSRARALDLDDVITCTSGPRPARIVSFAVGTSTRS
jgi:hypothetical protein